MAPDLDSGSFVRVRVVGDPGGDPPRWVRDAWAGIEFEARRVEGKVLMGSARRRRWYVRSKRDAWLVVGTEALAALRRGGRHDAAQWWEARGYGDGFEILVFDGRACEPLIS